MGPLILSILIFGVSIFFFIITNQKLKAIRADLISDEMKHEMEALVTEFNRTAARNIELIDDRIQAMQDMMKKADAKMNQLDGRIERANNPIVIEKVVQAKPGEEVHVREKLRLSEPESPPREKVVERKSVPSDFAKVSPIETDDGEDVYVRRKRIEEPVRELEETPDENVLRQAQDDALRRSQDGRQDDALRHSDAGHGERRSPSNRDLTQDDASAVVEPEPAVETLNRSDQLKALLRDGKSKEELIEMGYRENEINLFSFLIGKNV